MSKVSKVTQITHNRFLNYFELEAQKRDGGVFPYYLASRSRDEAHLYMNAPEKEPDGVAIYALAGEQHDKVVLVRQFRYPINGYVYEFPAGLVEAGEEIKPAAVREMKEETGLDLHPITVDPMYERAFFTTDGMTDERCSMVFGYADGQVSREGLEDTEELEIVLADREEIRRILREEQVAMMCAYMLMHFLNDPEPFAFIGAGKEEDR